MAKLSVKEQSIVTSMEKLDITREEAEELWMFDNDEIENEEVTAMEQEEVKTKAAIEGRSSIEKVKHMKAKIKADVNKENIIDDIFNKTQKSEHVNHCQEISATKMSFVDKDGFFYTVQVTKHKSRPAGYMVDTGKYEEREIKVEKTEGAQEGSNE